MAPSTHDVSVVTWKIRRFWPSSYSQIAEDARSEAYAALLEREGDVASATTLAVRNISKSIPGKVIQPTRYRMRISTCRSLSDLMFVVGLGHYEEQDLQAHFSKQPPRRQEMIRKILSGQPPKDVAIEYGTTVHLLYKQSRMAVKRLVKDVEGLPRCWGLKFGKDGKRRSISQGQRQA